MPLYQRSRLSGLLLSILALATAFTPIVRAQTTTVETASAAPTHDTVQLDKYVVSASRTPQALERTPSAVSVILPSELALSQVADLRSALAAEPGVVVVNTGAKGGQTSIFLRGANSDGTVFFVDGVRMNDRDADYSNFLGGADLGGLDRIEVLRGPQSTLYGSAAIGGVIVVETARGCGAPQGSLSAGAGSFDSVGANASVKGGTQKIGYSASLSQEQTANKLPANDYELLSYTGRLEAAVTESLLIGGTIRGQVSEMQWPGSRFLPSASTIDSKNHLVTTYASWSSDEVFTSKLTAGFHRRDYNYSTAYGDSTQKNEREILDWQNHWVATKAVDVVAGVTSEWSQYRIYGGYNDLEINDDLLGLYLSSSVNPVESVTLTAGARYDDGRTYGGAATWRTGAAWTVVPGTKLRATYATGFSAPSASERFGVPQWGLLANPSLVPEKSRGWDVGVDQEIAGGKVVLSATCFKNTYRNLIEWQTLNFVTYEGMKVNRARASTDGVEFASLVQLSGGVSTRLSYTYMDAENQESHVRLTRRPRHTVDGEVRWQAAKVWLLGVGVHGVAGRESSPGVDMENYTTARFFTSYEVVSGLVLKLRVENAFDEQYEEVLGYPTLPRGVFGSVEWKF